MKSGDSNAGISLQKVVGLTAAPFIAVHLPILSSLSLPFRLVTVMMPPEDIFRLEQFLTSNLPKMSTIYFTDDEETKLTMEGEATIKLEKA